MSMQRIESLAFESTEPQRNTLADGTRCVIRPLRPHDEASIVHGFAHLALETRRLRAFGAAAKVAPAYGELLPLADGVVHLAWGIAVRDEDSGSERGIGVGRVIRDSSDCTVAGFAIAIEEDSRRKGAGLALARAMAARSREIGIRRWVGTLFLRNRAILALLQKVGREVSCATFDDGSAAIAYEL
jgi:GNAT superfamily N-acetyltransferase